MRRKIKKKISITETLMGMQVGDELRMSIYDASKESVETTRCKLKKMGKGDFSVIKIDTLNYKVVRKS